MTGPLSPSNDGKFAKHRMAKAKSAGGCQRSFGANFLAECQYIIEAMPAVGARFLITQVVRPA